MFVKLLILSLASIASGQFRCPADGRHHLLPHETDCSKFYYCEYGVRRNDARQCPKNTLFSYEKQVCDHARNVICHSNGVGGETGGQPNSTTLPNGCPCDHSVQKFLPHEYDCTKFYECNKGKKVLRECAPGQHFNSKLEVCDHPSNAGCDPTCVGAADCPDGVTHPNGCPCNHSIHQLLPHESDCAKYYQCERGQKIIRECAAGTHFNSKLQVCDHPSNAGCDPTCGGVADCPNGVTHPNGCPCNHSIHQLLPHESDCAKYYQCERGQKIVRACAAGTHFNSKLQVCDHPSNAGCDPTCGGAADCPDGVTHPNGCPCNHSIHQLLPHESDCAKFYQCERGQKIIRECASGTHFNSKLQICDTPCNAGCDNSSCDPGEETGGGTSGEAGGSETPVCNNKCKTSCHIPHWRHETDCNKFWWCDGENEVLMTCPEGLYFNEADQTCDFKCNVNCSKRKLTMFNTLRLGFISQKSK